MAGTPYSVSVTPVPATAPTLIIPGFARGPNSSVNVQVPNTGTGIPVTLKNAPANTTSVTFTLDYNPALLNVTGPTSGNLVLNTATSTPGVANFSFSTTTAISTSSAVLGQIIAQVPNSAASQYKAKALLDCRGSYLAGHGCAQRRRRGAQCLPGRRQRRLPGQRLGRRAWSRAMLSATSQPAGFAAYAAGRSGPGGQPQQQPGHGTLKITTTDVTLLNRYAAGLNPAQIPAPPTGLTYTSVRVRTRR